MGTPYFAVPIFKSLYQNGYPISVVYTQPPKKSNRGQKINKSPIQSLSETLNIEFRTPITLKNILAPHLLQNPLLPFLEDLNHFKVFFFKNLTFFILTAE